MNQRYLIIEDEQFAADELLRMMHKLRPAYECVGRADCVGSALHLLDTTHPTFLLTDIRLSDGLCFDIFVQHPTDLPIIFTTAYDEYAIQAFRSNSVDYLLKPVEEEYLERALVKLEKHGLPAVSSSEVRQLINDYEQHIIKNRFLVQIGDEYRHVEVEDIAYFYSEEKYTYLYTHAGKQYILSYTLDALQNMLDKHTFYRVSRNCIASIQSIRKCARYFAGRLSITLSPEAPAKIIVSRNRATDVLRWMDDNM